MEVDGAAMARAFARGLLLFSQNRGRCECSSGGATRQCVGDTALLLTSRSTHAPSGHAHRQKLMRGPRDAHARSRTRTPAQRRTRSGTVGPVVQPLHHRGPERLHSHVHSTASPSVHSLSEPQGRCCELSGGQGGSCHDRSALCQLSGSMHVSRGGAPSPLNQSSCSGDGAAVA